jgi:hypothetical protein
MDPTKHTRAKFRRDEYKKLRFFVDQLGEQRWELIVPFFPSRNVRQLRERWKHYLSCKDPYSAWTPNEDSLLLQKVAEVGLKWTKLTAFFIDRTDIQIKKDINFFKI